MDPRLNLARGTIVRYGKTTARVFWRHLNPNRRPGIGRVSYEVEPGFLFEGRLCFGVLKHVTVAASKLEVV